MITDQLDKILFSNKGKGKVPIVIHLTPDKFGVLILERDYRIDSDSPDKTIPNFLNYKGVRVIVGFTFVSLEDPKNPKYVKNGILFGVVKLNQLVMQEFVSFEEWK